MRRGEALALSWRNVDFGTARIVESLEQTKAGLRFKSPKTDRARAVTLPSLAAEELRQVKREQAKPFSCSGWRRQATRPFAPAVSEPLQPQSLSMSFQDS